jgi:hypothetical protein
MSNFQQAVNWLKKGKKVRRRHWLGWNRFHLINDPQIGLLFETGNNMIRNADKISIQDIEAEDWEIYEEKYTTLEEINKKRYKILEAGYKPTKIEMNSKDLDNLDKELNKDLVNTKKLVTLYGMKVVSNDELKIGNTIIYHTENEPKFKPYLCLNCCMEYFDFKRPNCDCDNPIIKRILTEDDLK